MTAADGTGPKLESPAELTESFVRHHRVIDLINNGHIIVRALFN